VERKKRYSQEKLAGQGFCFLFFSSNSLRLLREINSFGGNFIY
jgi:hypothetical protein